VTGLTKKIHAGESRTKTRGDGKKSPTKFDHIGYKGHEVNVLGVIITGTALGKKKTGPHLSGEKTLRNRGAGDDRFLTFIGKIEKENGKI